ncbi:MAG: DUF393 domain-containing protein [Phycisphaerales bacterium]|nr:DUF393 domain-containing protein [Phycisphaerales bacterium]
MQPVQHRKAGSRAGVIRGRHEDVEADSRPCCRAREGAVLQARRGDWRSGPLRGGIRAGGGRDGACENLYASCHARNVPTQPPSGHALTGHQHPIILFDGRCGLCAWTVRFIVARDRLGSLRFAPLQGLTAARECARLGIAVPDGDPDTMILVEGDRALMRSDAALAIAARMRLPWRLLSGLRFLPRGMRDCAYRWVARHRHRWFGGDDVCLAPTPLLRERLLD